jgi:hypothetical protein
MPYVREVISSKASQIYQDNIKELAALHDAEPTSLEDTGPIHARQ